MSHASVLIVEDHQETLQSLEKIVSKEGYHVQCASSGEDALSILGVGPVDIVLTDLKMPGVDGLQLLQMVKSMHPFTEVVTMTAHGTIETAVEAIKLGSYDFITKPFKRMDLIKTLAKAFEKRQLLNENRKLKETLRNVQSGQEILGSSLSIQKVKDLIQQSAPTTATILIQGASGTGKELVAESIHTLSTRSNQELVKVNCSALPETLLESELFGYEKGAFTGASGRKPGRFELADGGTLFLDEIGTLPLPIQGKLLRVLQEGEFERLGGTKTIKVDVRIVAATNLNLEKAAQEGRFREDLYYRLNVIPIQVPPLKQRREDIPLLADYFLRFYSTANNKIIESIHPNSLDKLISYDWPGNVRELKNAIERAVILNRDEKQLLVGELSDHPQSELIFRVGTPLREMEQRAIEETLRHTNGNKAKAAELLGITVRTIYRKL